MALAKSQSLKSWTKQKWRTKSGKPVNKLERGIFQQANQGSITPRVRTTTKAKEKAKRQENNSLNSLKASLRKREVIEKLHNVGYFE